jgi:hypothetical protein
MRRRVRPRVLTSVRTAARNFDLLLDIAAPSTSAASFSRCWNDSDNVWRQQGGAFVPAGWKKPVLKRTAVGWQNQIVAAAIAGRFIIEPKS